MSEIDEKRIRIVQINNEISSHSKRKELESAEELFKTALQEEIVNSHTYAAIINANVMCGNMARAVEIYEEMLKRGRKLDVVVATTLMKGFIADSKFRKAFDLYQILISKPQLSPNIRTVNTILRGCVQNGEVLAAEEVVNSVKKFNFAVDVSYWEYLVSLFAQNLQLDNILPILGRLKSDEDMKTGIVGMNVSCGRAAAFLREWKTCQKCLTAASDSLGTIVTAGESAMQADSSKMKTVTGGKKAWKSAGGGEEGEGDQRVRSLEVYQEHKQSELKREIALIEEFMKSRRESGKGAAEALASLLPYYRHIFSLAPDGVDGADGEYSANAWRALLQKFGLGTLFRKVTQRSLEELDGLKGSSTAADISGNKGSKKQKKQLQYGDLGEDVRSWHERISQFRTDFLASFSASGKLSFPSVFQADQKPLKLEVCSGAGEWAVAQAAADPSCNWVTLELRHDRAYQTFSNCIYQQCENLCVLTGDATRVLPECFGDAILDSVFVNHPEPPQQTGGKQSQGKHLLTKNFFREVSRMLKAGGMCTVTTDNAWYGKLLLRQLAEMNGESSETYQLHSLTVRDQGKEDGWKVCESEDNVHLFMGKPGPQAGHIVEASSYFDRLWKRQNLIDRYFIVLRKRKKQKIGKISVSRPTIDASSKKHIVFDETEKPANKDMKRKAGESDHRAKKQKQ